MGETLFEAEGSRGSSASAAAFVVVLGVIGSLTMGIVAAAAPGRVGPWWIYAATLVASILFAVRWFRQSTVMVRVVSDGASARLVLSGPGTQLNIKVGGPVNHWISFVKGPHVGAARLVQYNTIIDSAGGQIGFWNLSGAQGSEPADWPVMSVGLSGCDEQFLCPRLDELVRILEGQPPGLR